MAELQPAIELLEVTKSFEEHDAVHALSLVITQGEFFSLLGPSGCGKTTTLRMIAGFELPTRGVIRLLGQEIQGTPPHLRNVNMVFQNYALFPHLTVFENIAFGLKARRVPQPEIYRRVGESLEMVRLPGLQQRKPAQLSGGQQQRVALARALVNRPAVLLLDEPLGALDQKLRKEMQLELKRLQREVGITFVYVTHDQEEALTMSDRIAVMYQGQVLQVAGPRQIYDYPATRFVADFIGTTNFVNGRIASIGSELAAVELDRLGLVHVPQQEVFTTGQPVTLAIRPERLRLDPPPAQEQTNCIEGILEETIFIGNDTQYIVQFGNGVQFFVREQNHSPAEARSGYQPGQPCRVYWLPSSTNVLLD